MMDAFYSTKLSSMKRFPVRVLCDTGASANVISSKVAKKWRLKILKPSQKYRVQDAQNNPIRVDGEVRGFMRGKRNSHPRSIQMIVCRNLGDQDLIIGNPTLKAWGIVPQQFPAWKEQKTWYEVEIKEEWSKDKIRTINKKLDTVEGKELEQCTLVELSDKLKSEFSDIFKSSLERGDRIVGKEAVRQNLDTKSKVYCMMDLVSGYRL